MLWGKSAMLLRDSSGKSLVETGFLRFSLKALQDARMEENNLKMILKAVSQCRSN